MGGAPRAASVGDQQSAATPIGVVPVEPYRPWITRLLSRYPGGLLTGMYLALTAVGVAYAFFYFIQFRLNILDYAQTGDFLVAAIREPVAIFYCVLPVGLLWLLAHFRRWVRRVSPRYDAYSARYERKWKVGPRYWDVVNTSLVALYALLFVIKYAQHEARVMREGTRKQVRVRLMSDAGTPLAVAGRTATLIGSTSGYLFLYDRAGDSTYAVPVSNVAQVAVRSTPRGRRRGIGGAPPSAAAVAPAAITTPAGDSAAR
ncbi:MAG TPA: hypothetical protein VFJ74_06110 [Gemmatimonadaceae bacterium]|nr:hypothetical protein [Gemmatimonadaceae bacterium]